MTYQRNPEPRTPDTHSTRVAFSGSFMSATVALGDLLFVRRYSAWHDSQPLFELRFRRGTVDMANDTLVQLVRQGQEALASEPCEPDCSGACFNTEDAG